jgi:soluble lytic murein transglycosylase-like protein
MKKILSYIIILFISFKSAAGYAANDPWLLLQEEFVADKTIPAVSLKADPWQKLRAVFLPFSLKEEREAVLNPGVAKIMGEKINNRLQKYDPVIKKASQIFDIPESIIKSVILAESGANPFARAKTTSAKGLMQTIDSTFKMARSGLTGQGIKICDNPFDPEASIMAGAWYLNRMYKRAYKDGKIIKADRKDIASWRYPLEYYYAGPRNGAKIKNRIYVFSNGTRRIIDKRAYSKKIQKWAKILAV